MFRRSHSLLRVGWEALLDLWTPRHCLGCEEPLGESAPWGYVCPKCVRRLDFVYPPCCHTCGHPFPGIGFGQACSHCAELQPVFDEGRCCLLHRDLAAVLVRTLKYHDGRYLHRDIAAILGKLPWLSAYVQDAVLVPVPLFAARERERGFNQSEWLARIVAQTFDLVPPADLLRRSRSTQTQTRLSRTERARNVRRAFTLAHSAPLNPDLTYMLVDDVFTTGATLNECARVLRRAGARQLKVLTLAHG